MDVVAIAAQNGGYKTWDFSQSDLWTLIHHRSFGICAGLSAEWIRYHADEDSLANYLGSGASGPLQTAKLREIQLLHDRASAANQTAFLGQYLNGHDIVDLNNCVMKSAKFDKTVKGPNGKNQTVTLTSYRPVPMSAKQGFGATGDVEPEGYIADIENAIVGALMRLQDCYARISFGGKAFVRGEQGHCVAVYLGSPTGRVAKDIRTGETVPVRTNPGDACFFDPNYGEFWFQDKTSFFNFFREYYRQKYRPFPVNFTKWWRVLPCVKKPFEMPETTRARR